MVALRSSWARATVCGVSSYLYLRGGRCVNEGQWGATVATWEVARLHPARRVFGCRVPRLCCGSPTASGPCTPMARRSSAQSPLLSASSALLAATAPASPSSSTHSPAIQPRKLAQGSRLAQPRSRARVASMSVCPSRPLPHRRVEARWSCSTPRASPLWTRRAVVPTKPPALPLPRHMHPVTPRHERRARPRLCDARRTSG